MRDFKRRRGNIRLPSKNAKAKNIVVKARHPNDSTTPRGKSSGEERGSIHKVWCLGSENKTLLLWQKRNLHGHAPKPKQTRFFNRYRGNDLGRYLRRHKISSFPRELEAVREIYRKKQARVLYDKKSGFKSNIDISAYHALHISVHYSLYVNKTRDTLR